MPDLLYEIGTEEIPASYIGPALDQLRMALATALEEARLTHGEIRTAATPRRLVIAASDVSERQPDAVEDISGPPVTAAYDADGNPTKAALGFAHSQGVDVGAIERRETERGVYCFVRKNVEGRPTIDILAEILPRITIGIAFPKSMVWLSGRKTFARPVRSLLALFGKHVIPLDLFGLTSGRSAECHPILSPGRIDIPDADFGNYENLLEARHVCVDIEERRARIVAGIKAAPDGFGQIVREAEEGLVDEVVNLVQDPSVSFCSFDSAFLNLPDAVIEAAMMEHQRYFPVQDPDGQLRANFIVVSDRGPEPSDVIRVGNEQVLDARLADAQFFDEQDSKWRLEERVAGLSGVAFLKGLGTYAEKSARLEKLAPRVARALGLDNEAASHVTRAAFLCKADLITEMVGEFPKLQGDIGRIYALRDGEPGAVAQAIFEHYLPRTANGALPESPTGCALSLTEKLDNLSSCFALGLVPTGSADPYALRRQAQAVLRIIEQTQRHFDLFALLQAALELLPEPHCSSQEALPALRQFFFQRIFVMAIDRQYPHALVNAAAGAGFGDIVDFWTRLDALKELAAQDGWQALVTAVERTYNISKDAPVDGEVNPALFAEPLEAELWALFTEHGAEIKRLQGERQYAAASNAYAEAFAEPLHRFFEDVFVNVEDAEVRGNRLELLRRINRLYSARIADLSQIVTGVHK